MTSFVLGEEDIQWENIVVVRFEYMFDTIIEE